jgi:hypothetical protein
VLDLSGAWKSQPCAGNQQLDADDHGGIVDHLHQPTRRMCGHRDMVLLVGRGRNRIDARRMSALLVLGHQRRGRHLRDHEARVQPRPWRQEGRQARQGRIDQHGNAPLGQRPDLANRQGHGVGREGDRLGVEVAAGQRLAGIGEDQRIVGDAIGLGLQRRRRLAQQIERRAHDLRLAAQAVGVLHPLVADQVRGADRRALHQRPQGVSRLDLAAMAAQAVDAWVERRIGATRGIGRQRPGDQRRLKHRLGLEQRGQPVGGRELRAVQQGEAFLGAERQRLQAGIGERPGGRPCPAVDDHLADADHRRRHVGERREVARCADRALARHRPASALGQHRLEQPDRLQPTPDAPWARLRA